MADVAVFTCEVCPFDGDAPYVEDGDCVRWVCPDCGWVHAGALDVDGGYDDWMDNKYV